MKERWIFNKEKLVSAEEGLKSTEPVKRGRICSSDLLIQYTKLVLFIELTLFVGWSSYTLWQTYDQQAVTSFFNADHVDHAVVDKVNTTDNDFSEEDVYQTDITPITNRLNAEIPFANLNTDTSQAKTTDVKIKDSLESLNKYESLEDGTFENANLKDEIFEDANLEDEIFEDANLEDQIFEDTNLDDQIFEDANLEDKSVLEWGFPFLWYIQQESGPFTGDSSEEARKSELEEVLQHIYEDSEKEESNDISESNQMSSEKEDQKEEFKLSSEDVPSSAEILFNLKKLYESIEAARRDLQLDNIRDDEFLENSENSNKDETSDESKSPHSPSFTFQFGKSDKIKLPSLTEEDMESSLMFPDSLNTKKPCGSYPSFWNNCDDDIFDSLTPSAENDESDSSKVDETTSNLNGVKVNPTYESREEITYEETSTAVVNEEDNGSFMETADYSATFSELENIDSESKYVFFGPRSSIQDLPASCAILWVKGFRIVKCSSDTTDSKSDDSLEEHTEYPENNEENVLDDTKRNYLGL
ncbi:hypothetical protein KPH14_006526 [Odynerus spinipes]|uniref:Uncharacterized protein n=1 Tax=Odynerus spinipes TaxID=1348599 RepID=A0AAD9RQM8_9HYME|nr:hypothetical protein KPH14_006526 [Odynerus spinipes]